MGSGSSAFFQNPPSYQGLRAAFLYRDIPHLVVVHDPAELVAQPPVLRGVGSHRPAAVVQVPFHVVCEPPDDPRLEVRQVIRAAGMNCSGRLGIRSATIKHWRGFNLKSFTTWVSHAGWHRQMLSAMCSKRPDHSNLSRRAPGQLPIPSICLVQGCYGAFISP